MRALASALVAAGLFTIQSSPFDHRFTAYGELLSRFVRNARVDYRALKDNRDVLDRVVAELGRVAAADESAWPRGERFAYWINAYNIFTLRSIVDRYPIRGRLFSLGPRNSIRQIDGVWTTAKWSAAGREVTLDDIEHRILRPGFTDPRVHMAINCASKGCPLLASRPYVATDLDRQLDEAARHYLADEHGAQVVRGRLLVSSIFKWYGGDFATDGTAADAAIRRFAARYGPPPVAAAANGNAPIGFLDYDWTLNDIER